MNKNIVHFVCLSALGLGCQSNEAEGLFKSEQASTTVVFDFFHKPFPNIPMPNDLATRFDASSKTGLRINASEVASTQWDKRTRSLTDGLDGWGTMQSITIPFSGPLDVDSIVSGHRDVHYDFENDVIYLINVDEGSDNFGKMHHLDVGEGNYPIFIKDRDFYWKNDPRRESSTLLFEEYDEDINGNGVLDQGEDTDSDGMLDSPNYFPNQNPAWDDLAARADAHMSFYEKETHTLIARPLVPLDERTTYAVVVTNRILDAEGEKVGSPFDWVHHTHQATALDPLTEVMPPFLTWEDVAFAYTFTTQSVQSPMRAVREGLYGFGPQNKLSETPTDVTLFDMRDQAFFDGLRRNKLFRGEDWAALIPLLGGTFLGGVSNSRSEQAILDALEYVDFFSTGTFKSGQLRKTFDDEGRVLDPNSRIWPEDLEQKSAEVTLEDVTFTLSVPRKEVSVRKDGKPAPLIVFTHGHTSNRSEMLLTSIWFAKFGFAALAIDAPGHGIVGNELELEAVRTILASFGLGSSADGLYSGRALDINGDDVLDSGEGFFTSNLFHTRDNIRQYILDLMQLIKVVKTFDGTTTWDDVDSDGTADLAGDVDGDGVLDIGASTTIGVFGGSMGGMAAMMLAGVEPHISATAPLVGGGMLGDIGYRSNHKVAPGGFFLQGVMGPFWTGTLSDNGLLLEHLVEDRARVKSFGIGSVSGVEPGDVMVVENLRSGINGCAYVLDDGSVRVQNEVDKGDPIRLSFLRDVVILPELHCEVDGVWEPYAQLETFSEDIDFKGENIEAGAPLVSLGHGLGRKRGDPNLRRLRQLSQLVLEPGDPINFAKNIQKTPLIYPNTNESTGASVLATSLLGDMAVPTAAGIAWARAAGIVDYLEDDARFGKPINQVLIDTFTTEGVSNLKRFENQNGKGVLLDVEHFSEGMPDKWGQEYPRMETPLHIGFENNDLLGKKSSIVFPLSNEEGEHVFRQPGGMVDDAIKDCEWECFNSGDPNCLCEDIEIYDVGYFIVNFVGRWFASSQTTLDADTCSARNDCPDIPPAPLARSVEERL